jgi:hypothetical protein
MSNDMQTGGDPAFDRMAAEDRRGLFAEFFAFLAHNKKWWLLPVVLMILVLGTLVLVGGTAVAPFIYTLF